MSLFSFVLFGVLLVKFLNCVLTAINYKNLKPHLHIALLFSSGCMIDDIWVQT